MNVDIDDLDMHKTGLEDEGSTHQEDEVLAGVDLDDNKLSKEGRMSPRNISEGRMQHNRNQLEGTHRLAQEKARQGWTQDCEILHLRLALGCFS